MKKLILINILVFLYISAFAQKGNATLFAEYEDTLKVMAHTIMNADTEEAKRTANTAFIENLTEVLQYEKSFKFPFDSLVTTGRVYSQIILLGSLVGSLKKTMVLMNIMV